VQAGLRGELAAAASKLEGYAARLALIVHLVRTAAHDVTVDPDCIDATSIMAGVAMVEWFGNEASRVYQTFGESKGARDRRQLVELIQRQGGEITARNLRRHDRRFRDSTDKAERALNELAEAELGAWVIPESTTDGGRPTSVFRLSVLSTVDETPSKPEKKPGFVDSVDWEDVNTGLARVYAEEAEDRWPDSRNTDG
jgi:hypothetical protein